MFCLVQGYIDWIDNEPYYKTPPPPLLSSGELRDLEDELMEAVAAPERGKPQRPFRPSFQVPSQRQQQQQQPRHRKRKANGGSAAASSSSSTGVEWSRRWRKKHNLEAANTLEGDAYEKQLYLKIGAF